MNCYIYSEKKAPGYYLFITPLRQHSQYEHTEKTSKHIKSRYLSSRCTDSVSNNYTVVWWLPAEPVPVLYSLRWRFWGFSPQRGDSFDGLLWNMCRISHWWVRIWGFPVPQKYTKKSRNLQTLSTCRGNSLENYVVLHGCLLYKCFFNLECFRL